MQETVVPIPPERGLVVEGQEISSSMEDYLETILYLTAERQVARAKDIGHQLGVNRSSVTTALHTMAKKGLINYSPYEFVTLTEAGKKAADDVAERHSVLRSFLAEVLRIEPEQANAAACQMEHALPRLVLERLAEFLEFAHRCPAALAEWEQAKGFHCGKPQRSCSKCGGTVKS